MLKTLGLTNRVGDGSVTTVIDGISLASELGIKNISEKQKTNFKRWFDQVTKRFDQQGYPNYYKERYFAPHAAKQIAEQYVRKCEFAENAKKVLEDIDGVNVAEQYVRKCECCANG